MGGHIISYGEMGGHKAVLKLYYSIQVSIVKMKQREMNLASDVLRN